jgi:alkylhydroperoxidase family enzyme
MSGSPYVAEPPRIPLPLRLALRIVERRLGGRLVANRILGWYPKALVGSALMEALIAHDEPGVPRRLLALIRVSTSYLVSCPFCIDLNANGYAEKGVSADEVRALQGRAPLESVPSLNDAERAALRYVACMCGTPLSFPRIVIDELKRFFPPRAIVIIASTCAQVNFWARLIQGLGVGPAGFSTDAPFLDLGSFTTLRD